MIWVQDEAVGIRHLRDDILSKLKTQLAETMGISKGKERKALIRQPHKKNSFDREGR